MNQLNKLKQKQIDASKPADKSYTLVDGGGLVLSIQPTGARRWSFRYRFGGRAKMLRMGVYPNATLSVARDKLGAARKLLAGDPPVDPSIVRKARKAAQSDSFRAVTDSWFKD